MGTREVYEEKLKRGNLHHDPTIKPGLGSARCPRCLSLLNSNSKSGEWAITPVLHDFTVVLPPLLMFSAASATFGGVGIYNGCKKNVVIKKTSLDLFLAIRRVESL
uniref:Gb protein n=1 Tax=Solanum tuberosum TaxID=4113 RepID=M1ATA5_SOLTU